MTLDSQLPRSSSASGLFFGGNRRKMIPVALALVGAGAVAGGTFFFSAGDQTPTTAQVPINVIPPIEAQFTSKNNKEMPEITASTGRQVVALSAPVTAPANVEAPSTVLPVATTPVIVASPANTQPSVAATATATATSPMNLATASAMMQTDPVAARTALTQLLDQQEMTAADEMATMIALRESNAKLFFSPVFAANDPTMRVYTVKSGDTLSKIAKANDLQADWRAIARINGLKSEKSLRIGQKLKLPTGAFHAEVSKSKYQMRIYAGEGAARVLVAIFSVGLGELNSTPTGAFMVRPKSKLINPQWTNPKTGEHFAADNPLNPIGERWIGLIGVEAHNQGFKGYGIHGTVDPASIGKQASMGCLRMSDADVELVYELLTEPNSTVVIAP